MSCGRLTMIGILGVGIMLLLSSLDDRAQTPPPPVTPASTRPALSPVILSENPDVVQRFAVDPGLVRDMFNRCLFKLTSTEDPAVAWARLGVVPTDIVGIKITCIGGELMSSHRPIIQAICDGLQAAGVPPDHIIIWDKYSEDMRRAGYTPSPGTDTHATFSAVFPGTGYDPNVLYNNEQLGTLIWGDYDFVRNGDDISNSINNATRDKTYGGGSGSLGSLDVGGPSQSSNKSHYARLVSDICTKIINVPVLTDNPYTGINGCLASLALGSVDNNRRFQGEPSFGDPAICEILDKDFMRHKVILNVLDALVAQYAGGPRFDPQFTRAIGAIYMSRDPVAIDSLVLPRLEQWRASDRQGRIDPIGKSASHIHTAATIYNLGTDDPHRIQLIRLP